MYPLCCNSDRTSWVMNRFHHACIEPMHSYIFHIRWSYHFISLWKVNLLLTFKRHNLSIGGDICVILVCFPFDISFVSSEFGEIEYQISRLIREKQLARRRAETWATHSWLWNPSQGATIGILLIRFREDSIIGGVLIPVQRRVTLIADGRLCRIFIAWKQVM